MKTLPGAAFAPTLAHNIEEWHRRFGAKSAPMAVTALQIPRKIEQAKAMLDEEEAEAFRVIEEIINETFPTQQDS